MIDFSFIYDKNKLKKVISAFKKAESDVSNTSVPMKKASIFLDRWVQVNFKTEGGKVGGWKSFKYGGRVVPKKKKGKKNKNASAMSIEARKHIDPSAKLLQDTGALRASYIPFYGENYAGIGSDLDYSDPHNEKRRMLPNHSDVMEPITDMLEKFGKNSIVDNIEKGFH